MTAIVAVRHLLEPLTAEEVRRAVQLLKKGGKVTPTTGRIPVTIPRLKSACQKMRLPTPIARTAPKRSRAVAAMRIDQRTRNP